MKADFLNENGHTLSETTRKKSTCVNGERTKARRLMSIEGLKSSKQEKREASKIADLKDATMKARRQQPQNHMARPYRSTLKDSH